MKSPLALAAAAEMELRRRKIAGIDGSYDSFKAKYWDDPVGFVLDIIRWPEGKSPYPYQLDNLVAIQDHDRVCFTGPHGLGKTANFSWLVHWFALTRDGTDWKMPITASSWRQLTKYLWPEVHKWARRIKWGLVGRRPYDMRVELQSLTLKLSTGEAFTLASNNHELLEGAHADNLLYLFDEAKAVGEVTWDAVEGAFSTGNAKWVAASTPGEPVGRFYDIQSRKPGYEDWHVRQISMQECLDAGSMKIEWLEARKRQWGETSAVFQNRAAGRFAASSKDGVIPLPWVEAAIDRWYEWEAAGFPGSFTSLASDVGGGGEDADKSTTAVVIDGVKVRDLRVVGIGDPHISTMELVGSISAVLEMYGRKERRIASTLLALVDSVGIGLGVLHRLRELGYLAEGFGAGKGTLLRDKSGERSFADWRSCMWWLFREMLEPGSGFNVCLPPDKEGAEGMTTNLIGDLTAPRYHDAGSDGLVIRVESKDKLRSRIHRSTDCADAVLMAVVGPLLLEEEAEMDTAQYRLLDREAI
jgi:hypothetical protein